MKNLLLQLKRHASKTWIAILALLLTNLFFTSQVFGQITVNLGAGTTTWTCPVGVFSVNAECWGGGAAGGGATGNPAAGGGGGGGGYVKNTAIAVIPGTVYSVLVAATVNGSTGAGANGGNTWFISASTLLARGGNGGGLAVSNSQTASGGTAVTSGNVGSTAPFSYYGGAGGTGGASGASGGGGGSSAGTGSNGNAPIGLTGGVAPTGGFAGVNGSTTSADGNDNANIGGGGAGGRAGSGTDRNGGNGGPGQIKLTYTALTYQSQLVGTINYGSANWCSGETRNVTIQIKNIGTATWTDGTGGTPTINIGVKWNTNGTNWTDYHIRQTAGNLAPGATGTYTFSVPAYNNTGTGSTTPLAAGSNNLTFDLVYENAFWFGNNGNTVFTTPAQTINALPGAPTGATGGSVCSSGTVNISATNVSGATIDWYSASTGGSVLTGGTGVTTFTTPSISTTTIYYAESRNTTTGCVSATRLPVTATVSATPTASAGGTQTICPLGTATVSGASSANGSILWTDNGAGSITSGATTLTPVYTSAAGDAGNTITLTMTVSNSPCTAATATYTVVVNAYPGVPTTPVNGSRCGTGTVTIGATPVTNSTIDWYAAATGGSVLTGGTGVTSFTPSISSTTTYYAQSRNTVTGCISATRTAVTATVNAVPGIPTGATGGSVCSSGTVNISATNVSGATIDWYAASTGGSVLSGGTGVTTFTTPSISTTTIYYAESRNITTGCVSATRLPVTASVSATPTASAGGTQTICPLGTATVGGASSANGTISWTDNGAGSITSGATTLTPVYTSAAGDAGNTVTLTMTVSNSPCTAATATYTIVVNAYPGVPTTPVNGSRCGTGTVTISATPVTNSTIDWYSASTGGSVLTGGTGVTTFTTPSIFFTTTYYAQSRNTVTGCISATRTAVTATVNAVPGIPTGATGGSVCSSGTVNISATNVSGATIDWYAASTGGSVLSGGTGTISFTTPSISTTTIYYAESRNTTTGCISATRRAVTATVSATPTASAGGTQTICAGATATVSGASAPNGTISWTDNGAGSITSGATTLTPVYTSAAGDAGNTVTLTMTVSNSPCTAATATYTVIVNTLPTITGITTVGVGGTTQLTGSGTPIAINPWVSSNTSIATVDVNGYVTGIAAGSATISYTNTDNTCQGAKVVTVNATTATISSTGSWTVPANVTKVKVQAWGGGGAGGGATSTSRTTGGGGGGGTFTSASAAITPGTTSVAVTIGAGGAANSAANGSAGGTTSFGATVSAVGGDGGNAGNSTNLNGAGAGIKTGITHNGGAGGTGTATTGTSGSSGGGGGGAGTTGDGGTASGATPGSGGTGSPAGGAGAAGTGSTGPGTNTTNLAAGGGGARNGSSASSQTGGKGGAGQLIIIYSSFSLNTINVSSAICAGGSTAINLTSTSTGLPTGIYTVTYSLSGANIASASTASMTITTAGTGSFIAAGFINSGSTTVTINNLSTSELGNNIIINNTVAVTVNANTWVGNGSGKGNFSTAANWSCGAPVPGQTLIINQDSVTIDANFNVQKNLTLGGTAVLIVNPNVVLDIAGTGTVDLGGKSVIVKSDATGTGSIGEIQAGGTLSNASNVTVERFIGTPRRTWRLLTVPVTGAHTFRDAWANGIPANGAAPAGETAGSGTLITGNGYANGAAAVADGFDWFANLTTSSTSSIRSYNYSNNTWAGTGTTPNPLSVPAALSGYMLYIRGDRTASFSTGNGTTTLKPTGTLNQGPQTVSVNAYLTVVGNPYAATIDLDSVYKTGSNSAVINRNFWIWDATAGTSGGAYNTLTYNGVDGYTNALTGLDDGAPYLNVNSGQAFFVEKNGTGGNLVIDENNKTTVAPQTLFRPMGATSSISNISVKLYDAINNVAGVQYDGVLARYNAIYSVSATESYDAAKFNNFNENLSLIRDNRYLSVESRPFPTQNDTLFLSFWNLKVRQYALVINSNKFAGLNQTAMLIDRFTNTHTILDMTDVNTVTYPFNITSDPASTSLSRFIIVMTPVATGGPLPVHFTKISAAPAGTQVNVNWTTASELGVKNYEVEKSTDGTNFVKAGTVIAKNAVAGASYGWTDVTPANGSNFYRIRSNDENGKYAYSNVVVAELNGKKGIFVIPTVITSQHFTLALNDMAAGKYKLLLTDAEGRMIYQNVISHAGGYNNQQVDLGKTFIAAGAYNLSVSNGKGITKNFRLVIN